jgi:hypothetical protein
VACNVSLFSAIVSDRMMRLGHSKRSWAYEGKGVAERVPLYIEANIRQWIPGTIQQSR